MEETYALRMEHVSKNYGDNAVLKDVSLSVKPGEIYALIGENGAGKSTLMNILFGMSVIRDTGGFDGKVIIDGVEARFNSPNDAMAAGIGMVHQEFMLIPGFTITENIKVGREDTIPTLASRIFGKSLEKLDNKKMNADARKALDSIGMDIDQHVRVAGLPVGYMQFVEIAREIDKENIKLLVFDEPTAVLTESEAKGLLSVMRSIAKRGIAIIFITHRLSEVMDVADRMTVLRDGEVVASKNIIDTDIPEIAELMVGRRIEKLVDENETHYTHSDEIALKIRDFQVDMPGETVNHIDLDIHKGEIFGIGGLAGQGKVGIPNGIMGMFPAYGEVEIFGEKLQFSKLGDALHKGVACVSEDRRGVGLLLDESIENNIIFNAMTIKREYLTGLGFAHLVNAKKVRAFAKEMIKTLDIRCTGPQQRVGSLSGGNQQKVCLASALALNPRLLIVSEPTRGIDIGAKKLILEHLVDLCRNHGLTIIMVSSELGELRSICDRIAIVAGGEISSILAPDAPDVEFGLAMSAARVSQEVS
ncbi:sugar ABC transporter ATP-binding protein [Eubacteriales bacterium OttesenSCG-928-K08]|nr:sugar ABC transporter ATP-binding protein [Eubacteriales bacterium OttesenSCG-928-K08]